jgi:hypothetical protein
MLFHELRHDHDTLPHTSVGIFRSSKYFSLVCTDIDFTFRSHDLQIFTCLEKYYIVDDRHPSRPGYLAPYGMKGIMCQIGGRVLLLMVSKSILTIYIQVFAMW